MVHSHTEHQHDQQNTTLVQIVIQNISMINKILQLCIQSYRISTWSTKYYNNHTVTLNISMINKILKWCRRSYRTSTCSTKYYNGVDGDTEHQHDQQNTTMVQTIIQNINIINKILQWCRQSHWTSTYSTTYYNGNTEHRHDQHTNRMV
jgi:hypothetical protein